MQLLEVSVPFPAILVLVEPKRSTPPSRITTPEKGPRGPLDQNYNISYICIEWMVKCDNDARAKSHVSVPFSRPICQN